MQLSKYQKWFALSIVGLILILLPFIIRSQHWMYMITLAGLESIVVMGFVAQYNVQLLTFCAATFWGVGAYTSGILSTTFDLNFWYCLPLAGIVTGFFAFVLGSLIIRAGWIPFLMISIVISEVFVEAVGNIPALGGWDGIFGIPRPAIGSFVFVSNTSYYYLTFGLIIVCILIFSAFFKSAIGKAWIAIGQSTDLAASVGINIIKYRMIAYIVAGFTAGLSGSLYAHYSCYLVPHTFGIVRSLYISINAVVGGLHFVIYGPIIGSIIIKVVPELFRIADKYQPIFEGGIIVLCALFFRKGVLGVLRKGTISGL
jgi:branched-chain amino acid transport system permease protein